MRFEKPYKYDDWLKSHQDEYGQVNHVEILEQFVSVSNQYHQDQNSHAGKGFWENGLLYVNYYLQEFNDRYPQEDWTEEDLNY